MDEKTGIHVDSKAVNDLLHELNMSDKEARTAILSALRDSANIIRKSVRSGLARISSDKQKRRGVQVVVYRNASGAQVNIYHPFYREDNGRREVFILRWLEEGTKAGPIKRGNKRKGGKDRMHGATPAKPFFVASSQAARPQAQASLNDAILRRNRKVAEKRRTA